MGVIPESNADGSIDRDLLDPYVIVLMSGRLAFMMMVLIIVLLTMVTSIEFRISLPWLVERDLIDPNHLFQAPSSPLRQLMKVLPLLQAKSRRGKEKPWLPEYLQLSVQLLRRVEGVLHKEELIRMCLQDLKLIHLLLS